MTIEIAKLNNEQLAAYHEILNRLYDNKTRVILLEGKAGTGKTFLLKYILDTYKKRVVLTAPTNKATKVLNDMTKSDEYIPECCTIYSLLGLQLSTKGEVKEIQANKHEIDVERYSLIVLDECFMTNQVLKKYIDKTLDNNPHIKLLMLGDSYQLPPVGEPVSPIVEYFNNPNNLRIEFTIVMRHEGNILLAVNEIRKAIETPFNYQLGFLEKFNITNKIDTDIRVLNQLEFTKAIKLEAEQDKQWIQCKVIAWRNITVDYFNNVIREVIFPKTYKTNHWEIGDRITITSPAKDWSTNKLIATVDDMGIIENVRILKHSEITGISIARLTVLLDNNNTVTLNVINHEDKNKWTMLLASEFERAKMKKISWKHYWDIHDKVHYIKHGYAITAHRAQGSTYDTVYVHLNDILRNNNRIESLQCLNVAASRARKKLIIGR